MINLGLYDEYDDESETITPCDEDERERMRLLATVNNQIRIAPLAVLRNISTLLTNKKNTNAKP